MEDIFNIRYDSKVDKVDIQKEKHLNKLFNLVQKNKFITLVFSSFISLSIINFYLIYNFIKILENV